MPTIVPPWGRKTERLTSQLSKIGLAIGGLPGSRLTAHVGIKTSRQTLLRLVMKMPTPSYRVPKVLGVDDWAYRSDAQGLKTGEKKNNQPLPKVVESKKSLFTVRRAVRLILSKPSEQSDSDAEAIALLKQQHPNLNLAIELIQSFTNLVRQKQPEQLEDWKVLINVKIDILYMLPYSFIF